MVCLCVILQDIGVIQSNWNICIYVGIDRGERESELGIIGRHLMFVCILLYQMGSLEHKAGCAPFRQLLGSFGWWVFIFTASSSPWILLLG